MSTGPRMVLATLCAVLPACTSVAWRGNDGRVRHAGLVFARSRSNQGTDCFERYSFGSDLRLSGGDRGLTIGASRIRELVPNVAEGVAPEELGDRVLATMVAPLSEKGKDDWHFFYFVEPDRTTDARAIEADHFGLFFRVGGSGALAAGWSRFTHYVGEDVGEDAVLLQKVDPDDSMADELWLWRVARQSPRSEGGIRE